VKARVNDRLKDSGYFSKRKSSKMEQGKEISLRTLNESEQISPDGSLIPSPISWLENDLEIGSSSA